MKAFTFPLFLGLLASQVAALPAAAPPPSDTLPRRGGSSPTVTFAPGSTVIGSSVGSVDSFNGIPFAQPPVGPLRLKPPQRISSGIGSFTAQGLAASCPQMFFSGGSGTFLTQVLGDVLDTPLFQTVTNAQEDCLTVNVQRPSGTTAGAGLPVLFWIFGGGFELGSTSTYDGSGLVSQGVSLGKPFIFVAVNYRIGGFGFLPGAEILADGAANLGLLDQRMGLEWVADNIAAFGGDPTKVTIWGESAGAISVFDQMALYGGNNTYNGKPLFRGAIMNSGSIVPADPVDCPKGQAIYDAVVDEAGCNKASDTLACLRGLDYETFLNAANSVPGILSYNSVALSYVPRPDGTVLTKSPEVLVLNNEYAAVPMIIGDQEDEGTLFSLFQGNISNTQDIVQYLNTLFFTGATKAQMQTLVATYPDDITAGSPFRTSIFNDIYPEFKRLAAILGDLVFTLTRRAFLSATVAANPSVPSWSYLASYDYGTPILGTFHGSDILQVFYGVLPNYASASIQTYYINFLYNLDPNKGSEGYPNWPQWNSGSQHQLMQFFNDGSSLLADTFRNSSYNFIANNVGVLHI